MNIFRKLFGLCEHKYILIDSGDLMQSGFKIGVYRTYSCSICHKIKEVNSL